MNSVTDYVNSLQNEQFTSKTGRIDSNEKTESTGKISNVTGKTFGKPKLSEKAAKYYEELKKKYSNMDFVLVSRDQKEAAKAQAGNFANADKMTVLIDEDKIEKMAEDENYRKKYESIISSGAGSLNKLRTQIENSGASVSGYGMQVNDNGTASFFAVIDKSFAAQKERIEKKAAEKKAEQKAQTKKAAEKKAEKKQDEKEEKAEKIDKTGNTDKNSVTVTASSIEELMTKINDQMQMIKSDTILSDTEKMYGQHIDFRG